MIHTKVRKGADEILPSKFFVPGLPGNYRIGMLSCLLQMLLEMHTQIERTALPCTARSIILPHQNTAGCRPSSSFAELMEESETKCVPPNVLALSESMHNAMRLTQRSVRR
jgi:hypothetical protein